MVTLRVGFIYRYVEKGTPCYFLYIGDSDNSNEMICAEVSTVDPSRKYYLIGSTTTSLCVFGDKLVTISRSHNVCPLFVGGNYVSLPSASLQCLVDDLIDAEIESYRNEIHATSLNNYDNANNHLKNLALPEKIARLLKWNIKKKYLRFDKDEKNMVKNCYPYNVYFAYLGTNIGSEIEKLRPVVIWREHVNSLNHKDSSYYVFPISSKIPKKSYYYNVEITVNGAKNVIHVNDGQRISALRIEKPLKDNLTGNTYCLDAKAIQEVKEAIKKYFKI